MSRGSLIYRRGLRVASKKICNGSYKRLNKRDRTFCRSTRGRRRGLKTYTVSRTRRQHAKRRRRLRRRCGRSERKSIETRSAFICCRTRSIRYEWQKQKWKRNFKDFRQEQKEEGIMRRKQVIAAWRRVWQQVQMPRVEEGRRDSKNVQEQGKTSQQLVLPTPDPFNEGTPASVMEIDLSRIRGAHGECGGAGDSGAANERKRTLSNPPSRERLPMEEDASL